MARRKISAGDWVKGAAQSIRNGTAGNPLATQRLVNAAADQRAGRETGFGTGEVGGDANWTAPVWGATLAGSPVTIAFGKGTRAGDTLICDGHVQMSEFYANRKTGLGHDHYTVGGKIASKIDTKRFTG